MAEAARRNDWDTLVTVYERWADPCSTLFAEAALDRASLSAGSSVLDVAAGTGALAIPAAGRGYGVRAIDTSSEMVHRLAERLKPYPGCSAEVMDALNLQCGDNEFDAAFSIFGVLYFGTESVKALSEMARVVHPGGVVGVVHWADPTGGPIFKPVAQAINRMNDPDVGKFVDPITGYLEGSEIESALREVGCVDVHSEIVQVDCSMPSPESFMDELDPLFRVHPQYLAAASRDRERFRMILAEEARLLEAGEYGGYAARANIAYARVPAMSRGLS